MSITLYIPKIDDYLKILIDEEIKDLVAIDFSEYFKSARERLCSKLSEESIKLLYIFLTTPNEIEKYVKIMQSNSSHNCVHY